MIEDESTIIDISYTNIVQKQKTYIEYLLIILQKDQCLLVNSRLYRVYTFHVNVP